VLAKLQELAVKPVDGSKIRITIPIGMVGNSDEA
jgi:hypothetical protein